jgi:uncharacterized damage-inducible protein DinB
MREHYRTFARYNRWANAKLYAAAARLPEADYRADHGAFFGSIQGTLNHILVTDGIWMHRFTGEGAPQSRLDATLHDDLTTLTAAREAMDARIIAWIDGLSEADLAGDITYVTISRPRAITQKLAPALNHFFNHQTHHRGQVHDMLSQTEVAPPSLDLHRVLLP